MKRMRNIVSIVISVALVGCLLIPAGAALGGQYTPETIPRGHYVNGFTINTPYGEGYHVDTIGSSDFNYNFFGYHVKYVESNKNGEIIGRGYFRQYDTFPSDLQSGRRYLRAYALNYDNSKIEAWSNVLDYRDGTSWHDKTFIISGLEKNQDYILAFGRGDAWSQDWKLTAEWSNVVIALDNSYSPQTIPRGNYVNGSTINTPYGEGYHVDTIGSNDNNYIFFGYHDKYVKANNNGEIIGSGYFRQYDTLPWYLLSYRYLCAYALDLQDPSKISSCSYVLNWPNGNGWNYKKFIISGLKKGTYYRLAFGRGDDLGDWKFTAEWSNVMISIDN